MPSERPDLSAESFAKEFIQLLRDENDVEAAAMLIELVRSVEELSEPAHVGGDPIEGNPNLTDAIAVFGHRRAVGTETTKGFRQEEDGTITIDGTSIRIDSNTGAVNIVSDDIYLKAADGTTIARFLDGSDITFTIDDFIVKDSSGTNRLRVRQGNDVEIWSDDFAVYSESGTEMFASRDVSGTMRLYFPNIQTQSSSGSNLRFIVINNTSGELRKWTGGGNTPGSQ